MKLNLVLKTKTKLILSYTLIVIITCVTGYAGFYVMKEIQKQQIINRNAIRIVNDLSSTELHMYKYYNESSDDNYQMLQSTIDSVLAYSLKNKGLYDWPENIRKADSLLLLGNEVKNMIQQYDDVNSESTETANQLKQEANSIVSQMKITAVEMFESVDYIIQYATTTGIKVIILAIAVSVLLIIILTIIITRNLTKQLGGEPYEIAKIADNISKGNLDITFDHSRKKQGVYASMIGMQTELSSMVEKIKTTATQLIQACDLLDNKSGMIEKSASDQTATVSGVSQTLKEMQYKIQETTSSAGESESIALETVNSVKADYSEVEKMMGALSELGNKLHTINDIAKKTNLLSLNASIEAARAGEHGKGFAVVAGEIKKLSAQADTAASEFSQESDQISKSASSQLSELIPQIEKIVNHIKSISEASKKQNESTVELSTVVDELKQAASGYTKIADDIASSTKTLNDHAQDLNEAMKYFTIN